MQIAIAAHSSPVDPKTEAMAREFLKELHSQCPTATLLLGGYWGFMKTIIDEALKLGFRIAVILPPWRGTMSNYQVVLLGLTVGVNLGVGL